jgi:hypothetical protein
VRRDPGLAEVARALLLPALSAAPDQLPHGHTGRSSRALRIGSTGLHAVLDGVPGDVADVDAEWFSRLRTGDSLGTMLYLTGCAVYSRVLRAHTGSSIVRRLIERVGLTRFQALMRAGEGPADVPVPGRLGDLYDAGGALLLDFLQAHAAATARHLLVRMPKEDVARWRCVRPLDAGLRDALVHSATHHFDELGR